MIRILFFVRRWRSAPELPTRASPLPTPHSLLRHHLALDDAHRASPLPTPHSLLPTRSSPIRTPAPPARGWPVLTSSGPSSLSKWRCSAHVRHRGVFAESETGAACYRSALTSNIAAEWSERMSEPEALK